MVIRNLDVFGAGRCPTEAHPELIVDADTVLAHTITFERFELYTVNSKPFAQERYDRPVAQRQGVNRRIKDLMNEVPARAIGRSPQH